MKTNTIAKWIALGGVVITFFAVLALTPGARPRGAEATANPLPPLIACPNVDASPDGVVATADILTIIHHYNKNYGQAGYGYLWDPMSPYNSTSPTDTGHIGTQDILYVVQKYNQTCSPMETQIAAATRAIVDPTFSSTLCDPSFATEMNCGGDPQFLTENVSFLSGKGYLRGSTDVPGQGIHYIKMSIWDGTFNPARPEGLVYKGGVLVAQLYYAEGDIVGWSPNQTSNIRRVNTDSFCTPTGEPVGTGCGWNGTYDGWHWHANLCTWAIGTPDAVAFPMGGNPGDHTQAQCAATASGAGHPCTAFYPAAGWNCAFKASVGYMGHLWNWLPNANYTNAGNPGPVCQVAYCNTLESNGRFADCFPDGSTWEAYNCPQ